MPRFFSNTPVPVANQEYIDRPAIELGNSATPDNLESEPQAQLLRQSNVREANRKARVEGLRELPPSRVARVIDNGVLVGLFAINPYGVRDFFCHDGNDLLARVQDLSLIDSILYELAALQIGQQLQCDLPHDLEDLVVKSEVMKDDDGNFSGWAVLIQPEVADAGPKRKAVGQQNKDQKRRV